jgi:hypothetical protein
MNVETLEKKLWEFDDGLLRKGSHKPGREFCALEFESRVRGRQWSDAPITLPDLRPINDAFGADDKARTEAMLPVMAALWDWTNWAAERRQRWVTKVVIRTVREIIAELPGMPAHIRQQCKGAKDLKSAKAAAAAARAAAAAARAAAAAARAAAAAADAAADAAAAAAAYAAADAAACAAADTAGVGVLKLACSIWIEAAQE